MFRKTVTIASCIALLWQATAVAVEFELNDSKSRITRSEVGRAIRSKPAVTARLRESKSKTPAPQTNQGNSSQATKARSTRAANSRPAKLATSKPTPSKTPVPQTDFISDLESVPPAPAFNPPVTENIIHDFSSPLDTILEPQPLPSGTVIEDLTDDLVVDPVADPMDPLPANDGYTEIGDDYDMGCTGCDDIGCTSCGDGACGNGACGGGIAGGGGLLGSLTSSLGWTHSAFGGLACGSGGCSGAARSAGCSGIFGGGCPCEDDCGNCDQCNSSCGFYTDLWVSTGFTSNANNPPSGLNFPLTFNDQDDEWVMNQLYLTLGRRVTSCGDAWDIGGRVDLLYGTDYFFTQAVGLETRQDGSPHWNSSNGPRSTGAAFYGLAMPQAYLEVYAPILGGVNFKIGHFYTTIGYESVMAPENFFYSHAYTMQYGEPFTHTGVLAEFSLTHKLSGHFGYTRGWDTWEDPNGTPGYLTGLSWTPSDVASLSATVHTGREDAAGINNRTVYSIVYTRQLNPGLQYVLQHDFGTESNAEFDGAFRADSAKWYGLNQYLFMDITEKVTAGMRFEWFRDQDNARVLGIPFESTVSGGNYWGYTLGLNWRPTDNLTVRPEVRWDESDVVPPAGNGMFGDFGDQNQLTFAFDMILRF